MKLKASTQRSLALLLSLPKESVYPVHEVLPSILASMVVSQVQFTLMVQNKPCPSGEHLFNVMLVPFPGKPKVDTIILFVSRILKDNLVCSTFSAKVMSLDPTNGHVLLGSFSSLVDPQYHADPSRSLAIISSNLDCPTLISFNITKNPGLKKLLYTTGDNYSKHYSSLSPEHSTHLEKSNTSIAHSPKGGVHQYLLDEMAKREEDNCSFLIDGGPTFLQGILEEGNVPFETFILTERLGKEISKEYSLEPTFSMAKILTIFDIIDTAQFTANDGVEYKFYVMIKKGTDENMAREREYVRTVLDEHFSTK